MILLRKESDDMTQTTPQVLLYLIRYINTKIQHVKNEVMYKKQIHLSKIYIISSQVLD